MRNNIQVELRPDDEHSSIHFSNKFGECSFYVQMLPGCCGVTLLYNWSFYTTKTDKFFLSLGKYLKRTTRFELDRAKMQVAATEGSRLADFCEANKWKGDEAAFNSKSGNNVIVYTLNRGVKNNY